MFEQEKPEASFDAFWARVPRKIGRKKAETAWKRLSAVSKQKAIAGVKPFYERFKKDYPTASLLHPSTYLNGHRWEDEGVATEASCQADMEVLRKMASSHIPAVRDQAHKSAKALGVTL